MIEPIARIVLRYLAVPLALWLGAPEDVTGEIADDPNTLLIIITIVGAIAAAVETWWLRARNKGRAT